MLACVVFEAFIERIVTDSRADVDDFDSVWKSLLKLSKYANKQPCAQVTAAAQNLFLELSKFPDQDCILCRFKNLIQSSEDRHIYNYASKFKLRVYPEEALESSLRFLNSSVRKVLDEWTPSSSVPCEPCVLLAGMLESIRDDCERDFIHPSFAATINIILERLEPFAATVHESAFRLYAAAFNLSGNETFCKRFAVHSANLINRIRERSLDSSCFTLLTRAFSVYYFVYKDSWATYLDRTESCIKLVFLPRRKNVLSCDDSVDNVVALVTCIIEKLPKFAVNELIKKLIKQCSSSLSEGLENLPLDRLNIAIRALTHLEGLINGQLAPQKLINHLKQQLGDLSITAIKNEASDVVNKLWLEIEKEYWNPQKYQLMIDPSRSKLISLLCTILGQFDSALKNDALIRLMDFEQTAKVALNAWNNRLLIPEMKSQMYQDMQCHQISRLIFNQSISDAGFGDSDGKIFNFFLRAFQYGEYKLPAEDEVCPVLRCGIAAILEAFSLWDSRNLLQESSLRLEDEEVEHFGRIVDVYFVLLGRWEALVKEVYLETIGRGNFIVRSWGTLVGFKQKSKEIADFLCSLLGVNDDRLRLRILNSFKLIPGSRVPEFIKLFEPLRSPVSDDLVHLRYDPSRRGRRNERAKLEVTRFYAHVTAAPNVTSLWVYKATLRHLVETFYFLSKLEVETDDFLHKLREEFAYFTGVLAHAVNNRRDDLNWQNYFPKRFQSELRKVLLDWRSTASQKDLIDQVLAELVYLYDAQDEDGIIKWILKDCPESLVRRAVTTCMKSGSPAYELALQSFVEAVCNDPERRKNIFYGLISSDKSSLSVQFLRVLYEGFEITEELLPTTINLLLKVNSGAIQRRILQDLVQVIQPTEDPDQMRALVNLTLRLRKTFPESLRALWSRLADGSFAFIIHFLLCEMRSCFDIDSAAIFICRGLFDLNPEALLSVLLIYAHPYSGVALGDVVRNYLQASLTILRRLEFNACDIDPNLKHQLNVLFKLSYAILDEMGSPTSGPFENQEEINQVAASLLTWATKCPLKTVSLAAWRELNELAKQFDDGFIKNSLLSEMRLFLKHLVCPESLHYFDPVMVVEILYTLHRIVSENDKLTKESVQQIFLDCLVQLETVDELVFDAIVDILRVTLEYQEIWNFLQQICNTSLPKLHTKLIANGIKPNHFNLLKVLLQAECNGILQDTMSFCGREERYFVYLIASLPQIFSYFDACLALDKPEGVVPPDEPEKQQLFSYLNALIWLTQSTANSAKSEEAKFLYLEIGELLASVESEKGRSSLDFYTILANVLVDKSVQPHSIAVTMLLIKKMPLMQRTFVARFAESLRRERCKTSDNRQFALQLIEAEIEVDQTVLDFLLSE